MKVRDDGTIEITTSAGDLKKAFGVTGPAQVNARIELTPDIFGNHGLAWKCLIPPTDKVHSNISNWVVEAAWAHPIWSFYYFSLIHLCHLDGLDDAEIFLPGATHEFYLYALNPNYPVSPFIQGEKPKVLTPMNFGAQFIAESDEAAIGRLTGSIHEVVDGKLSPDTDFMREWVKRYNNSLLLHKDMN